MKIYTVHQIIFTDDQIDAINSDCEAPDFYIRYLKAQRAEPTTEAWAASDYTPVCHIKAETLDEVFHIGNAGPEARIFRISDEMHSVSVGDVIEVNDLVETGEQAKLFIVAACGFTEIENTAELARRVKIRRQCEDLAFLEGKVCI